jgi:Amt family ammonium transporter
MSGWWLRVACGAGAVLVGAGQLLADGASPSKIDSGDTAWLLVSTALVMLMTPGLAFFYGGLVRKKNILSVLMQCFMVMCIISMQWVLVGYSLGFSDGCGFVGGLQWLGLAHVGATPSAYAPTVPHSAYMMFQMMFAVITPALIIGAFAERMRFSAFCVFSLLWTTLVYDPVAHWVWGGGMLSKGGIFGDKWALDFAGGTVVHINAGMAALAAALVLGKRRGFPQQISPPHNLPFAVLGAALLWFGWFGFNAGSALRANEVAAGAFVATHIATAAAGLTWSLLDWFKHGKPTTLGMITGAVAGLVAITPAAGYVEPIGAIAIGLGAGAICWCSVTYMKTKFGYDDSLDAFGVHGVGGIFGAIATGLFATVAANPADNGGGDGLFYGDAGQLGRQAVAVGMTIVYSFVVSFVLFKIIDKVMKLRVTDHEENVGLDLTQHREAGYTVID